MITKPTDRIKFPRDTALRRELLPHSDHSAKMNLHLLDAILDKHIPKRKLNDDGIDILDPMAGCGSILYALTNGYLVTALELEPEHVIKIGANYKHLRTVNGHQWIGAAYWCQGNAADWSGIKTSTSHPIRSIVFSPPYGDLARRHRATEHNTFNNANVPSWRKSRKDSGFHVDSYGHEFFQIGSMDYSRHVAAMAIVYRNCARLLAIRGTMVVVTADWWRDFNRVPYRQHTCDLATAAGFEFADWWQRDRSHQLTSWNRMRLKAGKPVIMEEDVQVFRRTAAP